jgi:hypothetical protein
MCSGDNVDKSKWLADRMIINEAQCKQFRLKDYDVCQMFVRDLLSVSNDKLRFCQNQETRKMAGVSFKSEGRSSIACWFAQQENEGDQLPNESTAVRKKNGIQIKAAKVKVRLRWFTRKDTHEAYVKDMQMINTSSSISSSSPSRSSAVMSDDDEVHKMVHKKRALSYSYFIAVWHNDFSHLILRKNSTFNKCDICTAYTASIGSTMPREESKAARDAQLVHLEFMSRERQEYYNKRTKAIRCPGGDYLSIIIDGADQSAYGLPYFMQSTKTTAAVYKQKMVLVGAIIHGVGTQIYTVSDKWKKDPNLTAEVLQRVLKSLENKKMPLPPILYLQLDNCCRENKNKAFMAYLAWLVKRKIFTEIHLSFLPVGHTHEDIDQLFSRIAIYLKNNNALTIDELHEACIKGFRKNDWAGSDTQCTHIESITSWKEWLFCNREVPASALTPPAASTPGVESNKRRKVLVSSLAAAAAAAAGAAGAGVESSKKGTKFSYCNEMFQHLNVMHFLFKLYSHTVEANAEKNIKAQSYEYPIMFTKSKSCEQEWELYNTESKGFKLLHDLMPFNFGDNNCPLPMAPNTPTAEILNEIERGLERLAGTGAYQGKGESRISAAQIEQLRDGLNKLKDETPKEFQWEDDGLFKREMGQLELGGRDLSAKQLATDAAAAIAAREKKQEQEEEHDAAFAANNEREEFGPCLTHEENAERLRSAQRDGKSIEVGSMVVMRPDYLSSENYREFWLGEVTRTSSLATDKTKSKPMEIQWFEPASKYPSKWGEFTKKELSSKWTGEVMQNGKKKTSEVDSEDIIVFFKKLAPSGVLPFTIRREITQSLVDEVTYRRDKINKSTQDQ